MTITIQSDKSDGPNQTTVIELPLANLLTKLEEIQGAISNMQLDLTKLKAAVTRETDVDTAILKLVQDLAAHQAQLAQQLADAIAANDPVAIAQVQADLDTSAQTMTANADSLAAAVVQNTPAA